MRNLIYISALDGFAEDFPLGIETWRRYASRIGAGIHVQTEYDKYIAQSYPEMNGSWYPWFCEWLVDNCDTWDKILIVDADTMVRWNAPSIFEVASGPLSVVKDSSPLDYGAIPHLKQWLHCCTTRMPPQNYFNAGMMVLDVETFFAFRNGIDRFYEKAHKIGASSWEQTPLNLMAWERFGWDINYLPVIWNDMLGFNYEEGDLSYINSSFVWHFTGSGYQLDKEKRARMMSDTYSKTIHNYEN